MASFKKLNLTNRSRVVATAYVALVLLFLVVVSGFYIPGKGFTYTLTLGSYFEAHFLPVLKETYPYIADHSGGYDSQHYVQIALSKSIHDPALAAAVDNAPYRARRILFPFLIRCLGGGDPVWIVRIYSVFNIACWALLAVTLLRWFPATGWSNFFRWGGVLFSFGLCFSVRAALVDGPSLLLIAWALWLAEENRWWSASVLLSIAGLGKETNVLAGASLVGVEDGGGSWGRRLSRLVARGVIVSAPLLAWTGYLLTSFKAEDVSGLRNFAWPFMGLVGKARECLAGGSNGVEGYHSVLNAAVLISLVVQLLFFVLRPQWSSLWWRAGMAYGVLMVFLGDAVWEGFPGAASRVLLPMLLAFNILVPEGRRWWLVLLLGNLSLVASFDTMKAPAGPSARVIGADDFPRKNAHGETLGVSFVEGWYDAEDSRFEYWRWASGDAQLVIQNPQVEPVRVRVSFGLKSRTNRNVTLSRNDVVLWSGAVGPELTEVILPDVLLDVGDTIWKFTSDVAAARPSAKDSRPVSFSLRDLRLEVSSAKSH